MNNPQTKLLPVRSKYLLASQTSLKTKNSSPSQEIAWIFWNPKVYNAYRYNSPLVPILSQINLSALPGFCIANGTVRFAGMSQKLKWISGPLRVQHSVTSAKVFHFSTQWHLFQCPLNSICKEGTNCDLSCIIPGRSSSTEDSFTCPNLL